MSATLDAQLHVETDDSALHSVIGPPPDAAVLHEPSEDVASESDPHAPPARPVRGRYAKFTAGMDVLLLEAMRTHNPFTAKHGTRLQMWQQIAATVGEALLKNPEAFSWHTCRDRVTTLMKLFADGKHDKLFKHGTVEENTRKEAILREFTLLLQRKSAKPGTYRTSALLEGHSGGVHAAAAASNGSLPLTAINVAHKDARVGAARTAPAGQKRRRVEGSTGNGYSTSRGIEVAQGMDSDTFRARVLELIESKIQFDMEQRVKENELREQEFELQKRFLEYLQSK